jgi:hypothetical protein
MKPNLFTTKWGLVWFSSIVLASYEGLRADVLEHWTTNQVSTNSFTVSFVTKSSFRFVAYGYYSDFGVILSSEDGVNWVPRLDGGGPGGSGFSWSLALSYAGGKFFALGGFGISAMSDDGIQWTTFPFRNSLGVAYNGFRYAAVMNDSYSLPPTLDVFTSTNGIDWDPHNVNASLGDIAYGAGLFVAIGIHNGSVNDSGHTYTSAGGTIWTKRDIPGGSKISFGNGLFIVPYANGTNLVSADGINWATLNTGISNLPGKAIYANGLFLAAAGGYLATSKDGTNWTQYAQQLPGSGDSIATDGFRLWRVGGIFVNGLGYNGYVYRSDPLVSLAMGSDSTHVNLSGLVGRSYKIESTDNLTSAAPTDWQVRFNGQLPSNPFPWPDPTSTDSPQRFYRAALLP